MAPAYPGCAQQYCDEQSRPPWHGRRVRFSALLDRASYLYDISDDTTENVSSLTDYYFDATSFQMSRVMKLIAVLTALAIIPTIVGGLLGANLMGNPWPISLAQMVTIVGIAMIATAWVFYRLGWFKS